MRRRLGYRGAAVAPGRRAWTSGTPGYVGAPPRPMFPRAKSRPFCERLFYCRGARSFLVYSFGFLYLAARSLHDVVPTLGGGVVLAADRDRKSTRLNSS